MDLEKLISAAEKFFFDLIGNVIPCGILLVGIAYLINTSMLSFYLLSNEITPSAWMAVLVTLYVGGYALSSVAKYLGKLVNYIKYYNSGGFESYMKKFVFSKERFRLLAKSLEIPDEDFKGAMEMRNYILSQIKTEDNSLTRRFRFISLLNISVSAAILICLSIAGGPTNLMRKRPR